jgi:hypothetical protein
VTHVQETSIFPPALSLEPPPPPQALSMVRAAAKKPKPGPAPAKGVDRAKKPIAAPPRAIAKVRHHSAHLQRPMLALTTGVQNAREAAARAIADETNTARRVNEFDGGVEEPDGQPTTASGRPRRAKANLHGGRVDISPPKRAPNRPPGKAAEEKRLRRERAEAEKAEKGLTHERGVKAAAAAEDRAHEKEAAYDSRRLHPHLHSAQAVPAQKGAVKRPTTDEDGQYTEWLYAD